ncbi:MAG: nucleolar GTP-binding protein [Thermoplasmata archaeon]|jgi:nucleolar GTP-binding protein|nr:nucleolar GTP-binding protein [Thermoplasmata archaeon]
MPEGTPASRAHLARVSPRSFDRIPTVRDADEILDTAFRRASKITIANPDAFIRTKTTELARVRSVQNSVAAALTNFVKKFPSFDGLPPFYQELAGVLLDMDKVRKALGSLDWAAKRVNEVGDEAVPKIKKARYAEEVRTAKAHAYGRIASLVKQVDKNLAILADARESLRRLPMLETSMPTIVVAGYPNVGKSSLVRKVSTGTPEVANYPFTTKGIVLGHFERKLVKHQIVDTPGLLDRDMDDRNAIEMQAIAALRHLADVIVFLVDPSGHCGYSLEAQLKLLADTKAMFPETPFVVAESKSDLQTAGVGEIAFSSETGAGVEDLMTVALGRLRKRAA